MFNQNKVLEVSDFLEAIGFVVPPNYTLDYFVVPRDSIRIPQKAGLVRGEDSPDDESITYHMTPPSMKHDTAENPVEYSIWDPDPIKRRMAAPHPLLRSTDPSELKSPFVQMINETKSDRLTFRLTEDVDPFKKGTLFSCVRRKN